MNRHPTDLIPRYISLETGKNVWMVYEYVETAQYNLDTYRLWIDDDDCYHMYKTKELCDKKVRKLNEQMG